jgi:hypothetical protein
VAGLSGGKRYRVVKEEQVLGETRDTSGVGEQKE